MDDADRNRFLIFVRATEIWNPPPLKLSSGKAKQERNRVCSRGILTLSVPIFGRCPTPRGVPYGCRTSVAHDSSALGAFAFLFQFGVPPASHWTGKSNHADGVAGSHTHMPGIVYFSTHLSDAGGAPLY